MVVLAGELAQVLELAGVVTFVPGHEEEEVDQFGASILEDNCFPLFGGADRMDRIFEGGCGLLYMLLELIEMEGVFAVGDRLGAEFIKRIGFVIPICFAGDTLDHRTAGGDDMAEHPVGAIATEGELEQAIFMGEAVELDVDDVGGAIETADHITGHFFVNGFAHFEVPLSLISNLNLAQMRFPCDWKL